MAVAYLQPLTIELCEDCTFFIKHLDDHELYFASMKNFALQEHRFLQRILIR